MRRSFSKGMAIIILVVVSLIFYSTRSPMRKNTTIDMIGENDGWKASLNMNIGYNSQLVVTLVTEDFEPPSKISIDILAKDQIVYNDKLTIVKDKFPHFGMYKGSFDSSKYLERNYKDVSVLINFNDEIITIPLTSIKIIE